MMLHTKLCPTGCVLPKFYGLPKIHKTGNPLRPIVSSRGLVTYVVAKVLSKLIKPPLGKPPIIYKVQVTLFQKPKSSLSKQENVLPPMMSLHFSLQFP